MNATPRTIIVALVLAGCSSTGPDKPQPLTDLPRALTADEARVAGAANQFALTLFKRLNEAQPAENVFVSPLSVSFSLGMTMNGANGTTLDEMRSTLGFGSEELSQINAGYRGLMALEAGLDPSTTFTIANSVWYRQDLQVNQSFVDMVKSTFEAEVRASPFDASTITQVNDWVNANTNGKIPTILEEIADENVMFLINAIYFKGSWREQFDPADTRDLPFKAVGGAQTVKTMYRLGKGAKLPFAWTPTAVLGDLVYGNSAFVMTVIVPSEGTDVNAYAATLDTAQWTALVAGMQEREIDVYLPKLRLEYKRELKADLQALGMRVPFIDGGADFTRMSSAAGNRLFISFVQHKTFVDVNEEGTEAAAVTNTGISETSLAPSLRVDRPFIFAIRERFSGTILFMGKIVKIP
jgi:serpin B